MSLSLLQYQKLALDNSVKLSDYLLFVLTVNSSDIVNSGLAKESTLLQVKTNTDNLNEVQTYSSALIGIVPANNPTDVFTISGSATKTVKIKRIGFSATKTTSGYVDLILLRRSTLNTGGTSTNGTIVPNDTNNSAGTVIFKGYTVNPTLGTLIGMIRAIRYNIQSGANNPVTWLLDFDSIKSQPIVLRGVNELLAINLNGTGLTMAGALFVCYIEFTEE